MATKTVQMTAPNGAKVTVAEDRVDELVRRGFLNAAEATKAPAKKSASRKSSK